MVDIRKAAVIGAGVMGSGIAAHLANAGLEVVLLDLDESLAARGVALQAKGGGFMDGSFAGRVRPGSIDADLGLLADADWIVEAVAERLDVKRGLYERLERVRKSGSIVSSNTSTIPLAQLVDTLPARFGADFLITHFFNPPRRMRLLELVSGAATRQEAIERITSFADVSLGKGVVTCNDTPGFIANRIGIYWLAAAQAEAISLGVSVEVADAVLGRPFGVPVTGAFGLLDLIGIDLMPALVRSLQRALPATDPVQAYPAEPPLVTKLLREGRLGRKSGGGFYRLTKPDVREALDLSTGEYRPLAPATSDSLADAGGDLRALLSHPGPGGRLAERVMGGTLAYAASLIPEVADTPDDVDQAMRLGYGWKEGPFELIDRIGPGWLAGRIASSGSETPGFLTRAVEAGSFYEESDGHRRCLTSSGQRRALDVPGGVLKLSGLRSSGPPVASGESAALWDVGDGVGCLELRTKANTLTGALLADIERLVGIGAERFRALIIGGDGPPFSMGTDLGELLAAAEADDRVRISAYWQAGHRAFAAIKHAPVPVVAAVQGATVGGGCELALCCAGIQAHAEASMGFVEAKVGLLPTWGGCAELLLRIRKTVGAAASTESTAKAAEVIATGRSSTSAFDALGMGLLRPTDGISMNQERVLADAKAMALKLAVDYVPSSRRSPGAVPQVVRREARDKAAASSPSFEGVLSKLLTSAQAAVTGDIPPEADASEIEHDVLLELLSAPATQDRIRRMLGTRRP